MCKPGGLDVFRLDSGMLRALDFGSFLRGLIKILLWKAWTSREVSCAGFDRCNVRGRETIDASVNIVSPIRAHYLQLQPDTAIDHNEVVQADREQVGLLLLFFSTLWHSSPTSAQLGSYPSSFFNDTFTNSPHFALGHIISDLQWSLELGRNTCFGTS